MKTLPNRFAPTGEISTQTFQPGDRVIFTPSNPAQKLEAGEKTVLAVDGGWAKLKCGDIRLVVKVSELKKI